MPKDPGVELVAQNVAYGSDPRQKMDVYRPRGKPAQRLPVLVFFYGGSWSSGSKDDYSFVARALASRGFLVAIPDYRLVPQVRYPLFIEDCAAALRWIGRHAPEFGGDGDELVIAGHSAGAYNGAMITYDPRWLGGDRRKIRGFIGLAGPYDFLLSDGPVTRAAFLGTSDGSSTQPVSFVTKGAAPALLATGSEDHTVLPRNSDALATRLQSAGSSAVRRTYIGVGHVGILTAIARPFRHRAVVLDDLVAFAHEVTH